MAMKLQTSKLYFTEEEMTCFNEEIQNTEKIYEELDKNTEICWETIAKAGIFYCTHVFYSTHKSLKNISCAVSEHVFAKLGKFKKIETLLEFEEFDAKYMHNTYDNITMELLDIMIKVKGKVCKINFIRPEFFNGVFNCTKCSSTKQIQFVSNTTNKITCTCKSKELVFNPANDNIFVKDTQEIEIIKVELENRFINALEIGDEIEIIGLVKTKLINDEYFVHIKANNIQKMSNHGKYQEHFIYIKNKDNLLAVLISTVFKNVHGNELVKIGVLLSLFGGTDKYVHDLKVQSKINVLIGGDTGIGKTKLLDAIKEYTGAIVLEEANPNTWLFKKNNIIASANVFTLSNESFCYLDDIHAVKSGKFITAIQNVIENEKFQTNLSSFEFNVNTTVICTTKLKNKNRKAFKNNVTFDEALLNSFDLKLLMDNKFTANESYKISNEIMKKKLKWDNTEGTITTSASSKLSEILAKIKKSNDFYEETEERIEKRKFRDYLEYCRKNVKPKISKDGMDVLAGYYLEEKTKNNAFVTKTLETLMNLSEAYAKLHMRNEVTEKDAQFVIKYFNALNKTTKDEAEESNQKGSKNKRVFG